MANSVIQVNNLSKSYRLGVIGSRTITEDLNRWWARLRKQPDPYLRIGQEDLSNRIGERIWALKDVNFEVKQGEALGIIGRNGAGKSTLLKILSRVTGPTTGEIKAKGRIASLLEIGTGFHPELTGRENIFLNGAILGMKHEEIERKFDEIVDFSGVEKFIDTPVKRYSSGMYVRLAFAVAAHLEPEILVIDEVLAVGDAEFQKRCLGKMSQVAGEGRTVLFVSHNMAAIEKLCPRCIFLKNGQISFEGETHIAIEQYIGDTNIKSNSKPINQYRSNSVLQKFIDEINILSINHENKNRYKIDEDIILEFVVSEKISSSRNPQIGIGVNNWLGQRIFTLMSYNGQGSGKWTDSNVIHCRITKPHLMPGSYSLKVSFNLDGITHDLIDNYPAFEIIEHDYFNSGKLPGISQGVVIQDAIWEYLIDNQNNKYE